MPAEDAGKFASPKATFATVQQAMARLQFKKFAECLTDDGLSELAGNLWFFSSFMMTRAEPGADPDSMPMQKRLKAAAKAFVPEDLQKTQLDLNEPEEKIRETVRKLGGGIKDRVTYMTLVLMALMGDRPPEKEKSPWRGRNCST